MGKLNILHHKDFHVYSKKNIEKVRKDEQAHLKKQSIPKSLDIHKSSHINLFQDAEDSLKNVEFQDEEMKRIKDWEKRNKITSYLVQEERSPWYSRKSDKFKSQDKNEAIDEEIKNRNDPMNVFYEYKSAGKIKGLNDEAITEERFKRERKERHRAELLIDPTKRNSLSRSDELHKSNQKYYNSQYTKRHTPY